MGFFIEKVLLTRVFLTERVEFTGLLEVVGEINFGTNNESKPPLELTIGEERWQQIVSNTKKLHSHLNTLKYIGWDIALNEKKYSFLEANKSPWLAIHQKYPNLGFQKQFFG